MSEDVKKIAEELVIACKRAYTRGIQTGSGVPECLGEI